MVPDWATSRFRRSAALLRKRSWGSFYPPTLSNRYDFSALRSTHAEAGLQFVRLMAKTGAHVVSSGDSPAGPDLVSPRLYRRFALPWEKRLADEAHRLGLPYALHIRGRTDRILDDMLATGTDALELDYKTDARVWPETGSTSPSSLPRALRQAAGRPSQPAPGTEVSRPVGRRAPPAGTRKGNRLSLLSRP